MCWRGKFGTLAVAVVVGCARSERAVVDAGSEAATPEPPAMLCEIGPSEPKHDLCAGTGCIQRFARSVVCGSAFESLDFALAPDGHSFAVFTAAGDALLLDAPVTGELRLVELGSAEVARVAVASDGQPRILLWSAHGATTLLHPRDGGFAAEPFTVVARPMALVLAPDGSPMVLASDTHVLTVSRGQETPQEVTRDEIRWARLFLDAGGAPIVVTAIEDGDWYTYRRWSAGLTTPLQQVARVDYETESAAVAQISDGTFRFARAERGSVIVSGGGGGELPVFQAAPWSEPVCTGHTIAYYPDLCPHEQNAGTDLGVQALRSPTLAVGPGGTIFSASETSESSVGCSWVGSCIETKPCDCNEQRYHSFPGPYDFHIWPVGGGRGWSIFDVGNTRPPIYGVDAAGAHHLLWPSANWFTLATFDLK